MGAVDRILQLERDRKKREEERQKRQSAAFSVVMALPDEDRDSVLAQLIDAVEKAAKAVPGTKPKAVPTAKVNGASYVDMAEAFVQAHPEGTKTRQVGDGIGQDVSSVDGSLRQALKRGTIERRGRLWYPKAKGTAAKAGPRKKTIRDLIYEVYAIEKKDLGALGLYEALMKLKPDINRASVDGEINRMKAAKLLVQVGTGPNNGGLYALSNGGGQATAAN